MNRRSAIGILAGAAAAVVRETLAQSPARVYRVAWMELRPFRPGDREPNRLRFDPFKRHLSELGFVDGRNLQLRVFAASTVESGVAGRSVEEAIAWKPDVIVVRNAVGTRLVQRATHTIPIVFSAVGDPAAEGFVDGMSRPGRNATGVSHAFEVLALKRLEIVRELFPTARRVAIVFDSSASGQTRMIEDVRSAAARLNLHAENADVAFAGLERALSRIAASKPDVLLVAGVINDGDYSRRMVGFQKDARIPVVDDAIDSVRRGMLLAVGEEYDDIYQRKADIVAKILRGTSPADIPVDSAFRILLAINLGAARDLGIVFPQSVLLRADRVFQ